MGGKLIFCATVWLFVLFPHTRAQDKCNLAKDLVVQARERIKVGTNDEAADGIQLLKHATEVCISSGDAWYYRSLFERKLGQAANADYALKKAKSFGSEELDLGADPFKLSTNPSPSPAQSLVGHVREKWALIVGISEYRDKHFPPLTFASKDADDFAELLLDPKVGRFKKSNVHAVSGNITTRKLKEELNWLARSAKDPNDLVVIFVSGHGTPRERDTAEVNYIATNDTELEPEDNLFATALPMVDISDVVRTRIKARRAVILLDTCHSGGAGVTTSAASAISDASASDATLDRLREGVGRVIITSSSREERSYDGKPFANGYFTHFLLEALRKDGGEISVDKVYAFVKENVVKAAASIHRKQTPSFKNSEHGDEIIIGVAEGGS